MNEIEGTTLTPRFPIIGLKKPKGMVGPFYVDDVGQIRFVSQAIIRFEILSIIFTFQKAITQEFWSRVKC